MARIKLTFIEVVALRKFNELNIIRRRRRTGKVRIYDTKGKKIAIGTLDCVGKVTVHGNEIFVSNNGFLRPLSDYIDKSGFKKVENWLEFVKKVHTSNYQMMYLYHLRVRRWLM